MEHRLHLRFPAQFFSSFSSLSVVRGEGHVVDLSLRGCRIFSLTEVKVGTLLQVWIQAPTEDLPIEIPEAIVRWHRANMFGLEFVSLLPDSWARLQRVVTVLAAESSPGANTSVGCGLPE
jgi:hypothetical protein